MVSLSTIAQQMMALSSAEASVGYMITISIEIHFTTLYMADLGTRQLKPLRRRERWWSICNYQSEKIMVIFALFSLLSSSLNGERISQQAKLPN
jgi:hypothetical protein